jgi:N-acyl-D-amino-acid deacylase
VFDPKRVVDEARYKDPHRYPAGIKYVLVNGELVVDSREHTGTLSGKVLRTLNSKRQ